MLVSRFLGRKRIVHGSLKSLERLYSTLEEVAEEQCVSHQKKGNDGAGED
jgi:hypothetical protein